MLRAMSDEESLSCPQCDGRLTVGAMVLSKREEDGQRVCRVVSACDSQHIWWRWSDGLYGGLEPCPYPKLLTG